ncbi:hypothetical protein M419DRAFT_137916 [Trichoderma reesei RUT C-30]|uniref:Uncharacterized protein n=1 Tax=Hypocrea jecorina (strain ATCC 56765 / BCRC 32924 / NRRL 11460 / Rut C-30) TaxID=1344414 RepID=A0A024S981_HYPJR|nr:hypothetical protein M419DRAFT_137916 [Trichoderma reesei RUT C-30]
MSSCARRLRLVQDMLGLLRPYNMIPLLSQHDHRTAALHDAARSVEHTTAALAAMPLNHAC